jgi:hypothetical protein
MKVRHATGGQMANDRDDIVGGVAVCIGRNEAAR